MKAYADYNDLMTLTEEMISEIILDVCGSYKVSLRAIASFLIPRVSCLARIYFFQIKYKPGPESLEYEVDFSPPWKRISMLEVYVHTIKNRISYWPHLLVQNC